MYCERNPLGHYEGNGGLFEFVPILVNVVSVRIVSNRATTAPRRRCLPCAALRGAAVPRRQGWRQAAPQPALHRQPVLQLLLRAAPLRRHPARLLHAAVARAVLPCAAPLEPTPPHHADAPPSGRHRTHSRHRLRLAAGRPAGGGQGAAAGLLRVGRAAETTELCGAPLLKTHVWPLPHDAPRVAGHQPGTRRFSIVLNHHLQDRARRSPPPTSTRPSTATSLRPSTRLCAKCTHRTSRRRPPTPPSAGALRPRVLRGPRVEAGRGGHLQRDVLDQQDQPPGLGAAA